MGIHSAVRRTASQQRRCCNLCRPSEADGSFRNPPYFLRQERRTTKLPAIKAKAFAPEPGSISGTSAMARTEQPTPSNTIANSVFKFPPTSCARNEGLLSCRRSKLMRSPPNPGQSPAPVVEQAGPSSNQCRVIQLQSASSSFLRIRIFNLGIVTVRPAGVLLLAPGTKDYQAAGDQSQSVRPRTRINLGPLRYGHGNGRTTNSE
jgi:hypothetical protein